MHRKLRLLIFVAVVTFALAGCESHQSKVDALQKDYDNLEAQFRKDCTAELMNASPTLTPKCADQKKKADDAYKRLQDEKGKQ
jgi:outer membrane murein-binding lipoprotein Lpp